MRKTYQETTRIAVSLLEDIDGKSVSINFYGRVKKKPPFQRGGVYHTEDEGIQKHLEKHIFYGKYFTCITVEEKKVEAPPPPETPTPPVKSKEKFVDTVTEKEYKTAASLKTAITKRLNKSK